MLRRRAARALEPDDVANLAAAGDDVLILGVDLVRDANTTQLLDQVPDAQVVSLTDGVAPAGVVAVPKALARAWWAIGRRGYRAVIAVHDYRNLELFVLGLRTRRRLLWRRGRLWPLGAQHVARREAERLAASARAHWLGWQIPPPVGPGNDYRFIAARLAALPQDWPRLKVSVIVPVYNRRAILEKTLAGLAQQTYPRDLFEVIIADDGSADHPETLVDAFCDDMAIRVVRQEDRGYRLAAVRNLATRAATGDVIVSLDCDMLPVPDFLRALVRWFHVYDGPLVIIGYRKNIDSSGLAAADIRKDFAAVYRAPEVAAPEAIRSWRAPSQDWRLPVFRRTRMLRTHPAPYATASGGNLAYRRADVLAAGLHDEAFACWGGEDTELGYRLERRGAYFIPEAGALAFHQDHPAPVDRSADRKQSHPLLGARVPYYRKLAAGAPWVAPKVSVYMPAYNAAQWITRAVDSALVQSVDDLEVCICDDGSSDDTLAVLQAHYGNNPRVRWTSQSHAGAAAASRRAVELCRGEYILQLDADDELLPNAARLLARALDRDSRLALVYGGYEHVDAGDRVLLVQLPEPYAAFRHLLVNLVTPPRMFRARDYYRSGGFDLLLTSAIDYDLYLKLAECGPVQPCRRVLYRYYQHGGNMSVVAEAEQARNHVRASCAAVERRRLGWRIEAPEPSLPRRLVVRHRASSADIWRIMQRWRRGGGA